MESRKWVVSQFHVVYRAPESHDAHEHYNFARIHKTLRVTPAMQAELADHVWSVEEIVTLLDRRAKLAA